MGQTKLGVTSGMEILQSRRSLAVMTGMEKPNDHAEPLQSNPKKKGKGKKRK